MSRPIIDLNADVGEGLNTDAELMPFITSANIACGYHAGNGETIRRTIALCLEHNVAIGAHPSFADRGNFGRKEHDLPIDEIAGLIREQLHIMQNACDEMGAMLHHVKPHGALYNLSARNTDVARTIAETVFAFNPGLFLYGLSGSHSVAEGVMAGLNTVAEVFADRTYQPDGSLTPRHQQGALIEDGMQALQQAWVLATEHRVQATGGSSIELIAESICLHGDGPHAVSFTRLIHQTFVSRGFIIQAPQ
ncbi:MAG TPA: 5-oxoprolinase subunit PxpA [Phnomibacter sp.]|nr:5-oxoprolinase subunit PxpA [Phnomibacter sp.]